MSLKLAAFVADPSGRVRVVGLAVGIFARHSVTEWGVSLCPDLRLSRN